MVRLPPRKLWVLVGVATLLLAGCATTPPEAFVRPVKGQLTSHYGPRANGFHHGVDLAAPKGTPVVAAKSGRVSFRGRKKGFGKLLIIDHGGGAQTYYAHLSSFKVRKGRRVKRGQIIGRVGKTGRATGHHLHFELRSQGRSVNPQTVLGF